VGMGKGKASSEGEGPQIRQGSAQWSAMAKTLREAVRSPHRKHGNGSSLFGLRREVCYKLKGLGFKPRRDN
jgi:hypothetical protein